MNRTLAAQRAVGAVRNALMESGQTPDAALHMARLLLTRPGVQIGKGGSIYYKGRQYDPASFAQSPLAKQATGEAQTARNQAAIQGDPQYIQTLAALGLNRDQAIAALNAQQKQALIQFGDPRFAGADRVTAGEAAANPFSTAQLLARAYAQNQQAANETSNRFGTFGGGGQASGLENASRQNAAQNQSATVALQNLLANLNQQSAAAQQAYGVGQSQAQIDAYNALLASGAIHAAGPVPWGVGQYHYYHPPGHGGGGFPTGPNPVLGGGNPPQGTMPPPRGVYQGGNPPQNPSYPDPTGQFQYK